MEPGELISPGTQVHRSQIEAMIMKCNTNKNNNALVRSYIICAHIKPWLSIHLAGSQGRVGFVVL